MNNLPFGYLLFLELFAKNFFIHFNHGFLYSFSTLLQNKSILFLIDSLESQLHGNTKCAIDSGKVAVKMEVKMEDTAQVKFENDDHNFDNNYDNPMFDQGSDDFPPTEENETIETDNNDYMDSMNQNIENDDDAGNNVASAAGDVGNQTAEEEAIMPPAQCTSINVESSQKYDSGSRFIQMDSEKYGRIVGFNGERYQVYFPHDKSCHEYTEDDFKAVKFIKPQKRPSPNIKPRKEGEGNKDKVLRCLRCDSRFASNPNDNVSGRAPVQSQNCAHVMCVNCVQAIRMNSSSKNGNASHRKLRATVDCPFCKKSKSFNAVDPTICVAMCHMVKLYEEMEHQRNEDRIRKKIEQEDKKERIKKRRHHTHHTHHSPSKSHNKIDDPARSKRVKKEKGNIPKATSSSRKNKSIQCKSCKKEKSFDKFSSKQIDKMKRKVPPLCRNCEGKGDIDKQFGKGAGKLSTIIYSKKPGSSSVAKFLTTAVPWDNRNKTMKNQTPLPSHLTIDGYTRDSWGLLNNDDKEQEEQCWVKEYFWGSGNGVPPFLKFLNEHKKSAYGTFVLPDKNDGFLVIPYDQTIRSGHIFQCKYVLGLGLHGDKSGGSIDNSKSNSIKENPSVIDQEDGPSSTLRKLLATEFKTSQSLMAVPQGSVKAAQKLSSRPEGPAASLGPANWFRQRIVIQEDGEGDADDTSPLKKNFNVDDTSDSPGTTKKKKYVC